ncbi:MAG: hypothetical protein AAF587_08340 [Bacteroidota bacterium]
MNPFDLIGFDSFHASQKNGLKWSWKLFSFFILAQSTQFAFGQQTQAVSILTVLRTYTQDSLFQQIQRTQSWADQRQWKGSRLREMEFRTETDKFDLSQQEFTFRLSPRSRKEYRYQRDRDQLRISSLHSNLSQRQAILLEARYHLVTKQYFSLRRYELKGAMKKIVEEKINFLALRFGELKLDPVDLAKSETDLFELESDVDQLLLELKSDDEVFQRWMQTNDSVELNFDALVTVQEIKVILLRTAQFEASLIPEVQMAAQEVEERYLEWEIDQSKNNRWIDFLQARVRGDDMGFIQPEFSIGLGLQLPLVRENRNQYAINELQWRMAKTNLTQLIEQNESEELTFRNKLLAQIDRWERLHNRLETGLTAKTLDMLRQQEKLDGLALVQLEEQLLLQQMILLETEQRVYEVYVQWLYLSGLLSGQSPRNYLSSRLEFIAP